MFALSRDGQKVFLHQPDDGMVVPVFLDFRSEEMTVRVPSVEELEDDYVVYDEFSDVIRAVDRGRLQKVAFARRFSRECSKVYREQIATGTLTIYELRSLVERHLRHAASNLAAGIDREPEDVMAASADPAAEPEDPVAGSERGLMSG